VKAKDVIVGGTYAAKVSGAICPVLIIERSPYGGWRGTNLQTLREVRIKSAQRLRRRMKDKATE